MTCNITCGLALSQGTSSHPTFPNHIIKRTQVSDRDTMNLIIILGSFLVCDLSLLVYYESFETF